MKKTLISVILAMLILANSFVFAAGAPALTTSAVKTEANTVELTIDISENAKICGCSFNIVYDNSKLAYKSAEVGTIIKNNIVTVNEKYADNTVRIAWAGVNELTQGGNVIKVTFDILDNASGTTELKLEKHKMVDINGDKVDSTCENASVTISEQTESGSGSTDSTGGASSGSSSSSGSTSGSGSSSGSSSSGSSSGSSSPSGGSTFVDGVYIPSTAGSSESADTTAESTEPDYEVKLLGFSDVKETDWFYNSVKFVKDNQLMSGVSETSFAPNSKLTRAMLVTILYRLQNSPESGAAPFTDVEDGLWYSKAVAWAAEKEIVSGIGNGLFAPNTNITREQIAVILYNYAKVFGADTSHSNNLAEFSDASLVSGWAKEHMQWAVGAELINGKGENKLDPKANATRAEIATVLKRFVENFN